MNIFKLNKLKQLLARMNTHEYTNMIIQNQNTLNFVSNLCCVEK